jgi:hypothetical protein
MVFIRRTRAISITPPATHTILFSALYGIQIVDFKFFPVNTSFYPLPGNPAIDSGETSMLACCETEPKCPDHAGPNPACGPKNRSWRVRIPVE